MAAPKLNIQGLSRKDQALMACMVAGDGYSFVSVDLTSGEPTVTSEYSRDSKYYDACFGMVGKEPYYDDDGVLMLDDIYLMAASKSPLARDQMRQCFDEGVFADWNVSEEKKEWIQKEHHIIGPIRKLHKPLVLGLGYAMGPRKMVVQARDAGHKVTFKEAKEFFKEYWGTIFKGLGAYSDRQQAILKRDGCLINPFGYRLVPDSPHKAFNYMIQSSVSGIINLLDGLYEAECEKEGLDVAFVTIIHDELIYRIKNTDLDKSRQVMNRSVEILNDILQWSVNVRTGWAVGNNMYEAK